MAVIGKIRQQSGLLIGIIGASIVGFLVMDATNSQGSVLKGRSDAVGKVNGEKISINDFEKKYEENIKNQEIQMRGQPLNDDMRNYLRNQTWDQIVNDVIFKEVYSNLGISVTPEEMSELATGQNPHPYVKQSFSNPQTGQFDPAQVRYFIQNLDNDDPGTEPGTRRKQWLAFEAEVKKNQYQTKYDNLISKGLFVPNWMGESNYKEQNTTVDFKYISLPYSQVADDAVKVSDDDLAAYIKKNAAKFKVDDETRKVQYVTFDIIASSADSAQTIESLEEKREEFVSGKTISDDSLFVKLYSETPFDVVYYTKDQLFSPVTDSLFALPVKSVVGPYLDGEFYKMAKITDRKMISDSVKLRQIKISFNDVTTQEAGVAKRKTVDSVFKAIDSLKADFGLMALLHSDDQATKMQGGNIGWVKQNEREKEMNDLIFYRAQKGKTYLHGSAQDNAFYIFQIVEDKPSKMGVLATYMSKQIIPSPETERNIYSNATAFAADNQEKEKFLEAGKKLNIKAVGDLKADQFSVAGLGTARDLVKWAFKANKGDVSSIFTVSKKHVIAILEDVTPKGLPSVDAVRETAKAGVLKEKKFEQLAKQVADAKAADINALAAKLNTSVQEAMQVSISNPSVGGAYEPAVAGAALATAEGKLSAAVKGNSGVYVVQTVAVKKPGVMNDYSAYAYQLKQKNQSKAISAAAVQKKLADIKDSRSDFF
ncbi:MAG: SurA N-terminal domain-containing protein [Chitinophagales bacterium]|nr:SurA N-terminal domain-containing protein [Chitinophagales bacterium]